jgi:hypothetical protein
MTPQNHDGRGSALRLMKSLCGTLVLAHLFAELSAAASGDPIGAPILNPAPRAKDWATLATLPDWSGTWTPAPDDRAFPLGKKEPRWLPDVARQIEQMKADEAAGKPQPVFVNCLPEGMPSFTLMTLNALEFLFTPGRVTILGEFDGNRLRRIYTDGRKHPDDPDLTFNGHSIGHWENGTLIVDTVALLPEVVLPLGQAVAIPNNGDMHIEERIHLVSADRLIDELVITAPHVLAEPWKISRSFVRSRERKFDIIEASCRQGDFFEAKDENGNAIFLPVEHEQGGAPYPPPPTP